MRFAWVLIAASAATAHADPGLFEWNADTELRPARVLIEAQCDLDVVVRGAVVDVELHQRLANTGPEPFAATEELALPDGAQLTGFAVRTRTTEVALPVPASSATETKDPDVLGADPAIVKKVGSDYHVVTAPVARDGDLTLVTHWSVLADIHDGGLHVVLPHRSNAPACRGRIRATPGPGATVRQIRADHAVVGRTGAFDLVDHDVELAVDLAFAAKTPVAWVQREELGDGLTAQALTVIAPAAPLAMSRAIFVIDGSRSMELVGGDRVKKVVDAIVAALPPATQLEGIIYDRAATRVFGSWRALDAVPELHAAIDRHVAGGGSDLAAALALAHQAIADDPHAATTIIAITDGVVADDALVPADRDVHVIALDPPAMHAPGRELLTGAAARANGAYVEVTADELDGSMAGAGVADWLRPAWFELTGGVRAIPDEVLGGGGFVATSIVRAPKSIVIRGHGAASFSTAAREAPHASIAQLVLARTTDRDFIRTTDRDANDTAELDAARHLRWRVADRHPAVDADHALAVLSTKGRVAHQRHQVVAGGGPYTRTVELEDPVFRISMAPTPTAGGSALDRSIIQRLLVDQLQPRGFTCYEHALGHAPALAGTATVQLDISRGEITRATIGGLGDPAFDACFLDAAYAITPPFPTLGYNTDDRSIVNYALTFTIHDQHPLVIPGDADSSTAIDIDAIQGGVARPHLDLDTHTPLGNLKVTPPAARDRP